MTVNVEEPQKNSIIDQGKGFTGLVGPRVFVEMPTA